MVKKKPQTEKKKLRTIGRILKWIGLFAISFLIILALRFQAPWKVTALLLIILAACTVLPKPYRKWFWLSVSVILLALIIWIFLPDRGLWKPYRHNFKQGLKDLNEKYRVPDEENAAVIYKELLQDSVDLFPDLPDSNTYFSARLYPWLNKDHPIFAQWLVDNKSKITMLHQVSRMEKCQFIVDEDSLRSLGPVARPHLRLVQTVAWLLVCASNNDLAEKRLEEAFEKQAVLLRISEHLRQQPITIDVKAGIAFQALALSRLNMFLVTENPTKPYLEKLDNTISGIKYDWEVTWAKISDYEKLSIMKDRFWMLYETNTRGKTRVVVADFFRYFKPISLPDVPYWNTRRAKASSILAWFFLPQTPAKATDIIEETLNKYGRAEYLNSQWGTESPLRFNFSYVIDLYVENYVNSLYNLFMRLKSDATATRIIIALTQYKGIHGSWPEKLDDIKSLAPQEIFIDPVNNGHFVYRPTEQNFILYSRGRNNIDENGKGNFRNIEGPDDWLIWPLKTSRTSKEEKANDEQ